MSRWHQGEIKRLPDFDSRVRPLIIACGGTETELVDWRRRHEVPTAVHSALKQQPGKPPEKAPTPAQHSGLHRRTDQPLPLHL
jgi:hypothetical protein